MKNKRERLLEILEHLDKLEKAKNGLEMYKQLCEVLHSYEDQIHGSDLWSPPRTFLNDERTDRIYQIYTESFHSVSGFNGVTILISKKEIIFISRFGAIEVQEKDEVDKFGLVKHFSDRKDKIIYMKKDFYGDDVWHKKNIN